MTTQRRPLVIAALIGLITPAVVSATGPVGFSHCTRTMDPSILTAPIDRSRLVTIAQIKASSRHEDLVYLKGRFTKHLRCETYEFTDLAGDTIGARLNDDVNWSHVRRDDLVEIMAKVNTKRKVPELDVQVARPMK